MTSAPDRIHAAHADAQACRDSEGVIEFAGRRWVALVLLTGHQGARRFTEYRHFAAGISDRLLAQRLRGGTRSRNTGVTHAT